MIDNKKYPWYLKLIDLPGALVFLMFLGMILLYVSLCTTSAKKMRRITRLLLPFVLAIFLSVVGYSIQNTLILEWVKYATIFSVIYLMMNTFRFSQSPLSFLDNYLLEKIQSEKRLVPDLAKEAIAKAKDYDTSEIASTKTATVTILIVTFAKALVKAAGNPRIVLGLFLINYFFSIFLTISLFGVLLKTTFIQFYNYDSLSFFLASTLRFTAWSSTNEILNGYNNQWVLAFESVVTFFYIVIAITSFGTVSSHTVKEFQEKLLLVYDQEMKSLGDIQTDLIKEEIKFDE